MVQDARFEGPGPDAIWHAALGEGRFELQRCADCGAFQHPPTVNCRSCHGIALTLTPISGAGVVYATTTVRSREGGHNVSLVTLAEGPRVMTNVTGDPEQVRIGQPVIARIIPGDPAKVVFDPEGTA